MQVNLGPCWHIDLGDTGDVVIGGKPVRSLLTVLGEDEQSDQAIAQMLVVVIEIAKGSKLDTDALLNGDYEMVRKSD